MCKNIRKQLPWRKQFYENNFTHLDYQDNTPKQPSDKIIVFLQETVEYIN